MNIVADVIGIAKYFDWLAIDNSVEGHTNKALPALRREQHTIRVGNPKRYSGEPTMFGSQSEVVLCGEFLDPIRGGWRRRVCLSCRAAGCQRSVDGPAAAREDKVSTSASLANGLHQVQGRHQVGQGVARQMPIRGEGRTAVCQVKHDIYVAHEVGAIIRLIQITLHPVHTGVCVNLACP